MAGDEQQVYQLSDLDVEAIGLVRRGANRKPFYVIKSESGGGNVDEVREEDNFSEVLEELEAVETINESAWQKLVGVVKSALVRPEPEPEPEPTAEPEAEQFADLTDADKARVSAFLKALGKAKLGERAYALLEKLAGGNPGKKTGYGYPPKEEKDAEEAADEFAEKLAEAEARFTEQLETERKKREEFAEKFAAEQRLRRLREFSDMVGQEFSALPVGKAEEFAADLMAIHDADEERYGRLVQVLKASQEAVKQGGLFEQYASAQPAEHGEPFLAAVEKIRQERFSDKPKDTGWAEAFTVAMHEHPDLARAYEKATR